MVIKSQNSQNCSEEWWNSSLLEDMDNINFASMVQDSPKEELCQSKNAADAKEATGKARKKSSVEMVDRGVGPTPAPDPSLDFGIPPSFFGLPPYVTDSAMGYPCLYPPLPYSFNPPLPVNSTTNEGRYRWPPTATPLQGHRTGASAIMADLASGFPLRSPFQGDATAAAATAALASRLQWEQYQRMAAIHQHGAYAINHRLGISSNNVSFGFQDGSLPPHPFSPHLAFAAASQKSIFNEHPATPGSGSITLPGSLESSRLASPHPSVTLKHNARKRALSHSPLEFGLDIESLTRSSEGSLHLQPFAHSSQTSSNASGSYGHLSAMSLSALGVFGHPVVRHGSVQHGMLYSPMLHPCFLSPYQAAAAAATLSPLGTARHVTTPAANVTAPRPEPKKSMTGLLPREMGCSSSSLVSSTVSRNAAEPRKPRTRKEDCGQQPSDGVGEEGFSAEDISTRRQQCFVGNELSAGERTAQEGEPDFYETNCHWRGCFLEFGTQEELVKHLNLDHIASNKKFFVCQWEGCQRQKRPFKAQYMLVVHMRRHTGEKPHHCQFEGCQKAYSRLENLKTHMRSHTGEKPYLCKQPGCSKAFSNASDRAKHQNRTHSNAKPYACKAPGCTKCYTDPSSLRKHVKTVHGADFYTSKKHKGEDFPSNPDLDEDNSGGRRHFPYTGHSGEAGGARDALMNRKPEGTGNSGSSGSGHSFDVLKVEDCLMVSSLKPGNCNMKKSNAAVAEEGSKTYRQHRGKTKPRSRNCVSVRCPPGPVEFDGSIDNLVSSSCVGDHIPMEAEENILNEVLLPATAVSVSDQRLEETASMSCLPPVGFMPRINPKGKLTSRLATLPPLGNAAGQNFSLPRGYHGNPDFRGMKPDAKTRNQCVSKKTMDSLNVSLRDAVYGSRRRDSSTSTLSSYMSSIRSDSSPCQQLFQSSRCPSYSSQRSVAPSPYEYDIPDCLSGSNVKATDSMVGSSGSLTYQMARTRLADLHVSSGSDQLGHGSLVRFLASHRDHSNKRLAVPGTPSRTPLPHEIPNHDIRRASDPVRSGIGNLSAVREFQRCHSLNAVPVQRRMVPKPTQRHISTDLLSNYNSSCTSIATDYSQASEMNPFLEESDLSGSWPMVDEAMLEKQMMYDASHNSQIITNEIKEYLDASGFGDGASFDANGIPILSLDHLDLLGQSNELESGLMIGEGQGDAINPLKVKATDEWKSGNEWDANIEGDLEFSGHPRELPMLNVISDDAGLPSDRQLPLLCYPGQQEMDRLFSAGAGNKISQMGQMQAGGGSQLHASAHQRAKGLSGSQSIPQDQVTQVSQLQRLLGRGRVTNSNVLTDNVSSTIRRGVAASITDTDTASVTGAMLLNRLYQSCLPDQGTMQNQLCSAQSHEFPSDYDYVENNGISFIDEQSLSSVLSNSFPTDFLQRCQPAGNQNSADSSQQVSSSTDVLGPAGEDDHLVDTVFSIANPCSMSLEQVMSSPTLMTNCSSSSTVSRLTTPRADDKSSAAQSLYLTSSNMVVNDMNSMLAQLAEENTYRNIYG